MFLSWEVSVQFSLSVMSYSATPWTAAHQASHPAWTPGGCSNSCPSSQWCHPTISSSVIPFSCCLQSFPASGSFPKSQLFTSGGQSIRVSASASVFPMNIQDWFPLGWTGLTSFKSKEHSRVLSNTTVQKHQFFTLSNGFSATIVIIMCLMYFIVLIWCILLIDIYMLQYPRIHGINCTWWLRVILCNVFLI